MIVNAIKNRDDALIFFGDYRELAENYATICNEKFNFNNRAIKLFELFPKLIENIIKREAYLLNEVNIIMGHAQRSNKENNLFDIINNIFSTPTYDFKYYIKNNLSGISINQYRNIVAHSSFELENNKIYASYGNNKRIILSIEELEKIHFEIYRFRTVIKLCMNISIDFMLAYYPELRGELRTIPQTILIDINAILKETGIEIISMDITDSLVIDDEKISQDDQVFFIMDIESKEMPLVKTVEIIFLTISNFLPMFKEKNNFPELSEILWFIKTKFIKEDLAINFAISYDEIKMLQSNPIGYSKMIAKKIIKQLNRTE